MLPGTAELRCRITGPEVALGSVFIPRQQSRCLGSMEPVKEGERVNYGDVRGEEHSVARTLSGMAERSP